MLDLDLEQLAPERVRPIRRDEYDQMVAMGLFEDERVELLRGVLVEMTPQGTRHAGTIEELTHRLVIALDGRARVRPQLPLDVGDHSEPEPDLAVVSLGNHLDEHPTAALLVIEVADASLRKDRHIKTALYAEAGVLEYWIINLVDRVLEVYRKPERGHYREVHRHGSGETVALAAFPDVRLAVADIVPAAETT